MDPKILNMGQIIYNMAHIMYNMAHIISYYMIHIFNLYGQIAHSNFY